MLRKTVAVLAAALLCASMSTPAKAADGKIGVANPIRISTQSDPGKEAQRQLESMFGKERKQLEQQNADLNKQAEDLRKQAAALSDKARSERAQKLQKTAQELDSKGAAFAQRLQRVQQDINAQMNDVLLTASKNYAQKNGYEMIIDSQVVMFFTTPHDVTEGLIKEVNSVWKSRGGKFKISSK
ncbi:MAG: OmpH family outer membrane protein [Mailhella sp.]|nr:OmpH family outer membrane protein [Mailhella sp.]